MFQTTIIVWVGRNLKYPKLEDDALSIHRRMDCRDTSSQCKATQGYLYRKSSKQLVKFPAEKIHKYCLKTMAQPAEGSLLQVQNPNKTGRCFSFNIHPFTPTVFCPTPPTCQQQLSPYKCFWEDVFFPKKQEVKTIWKGVRKSFIPNPLLTS